MTRFYSGCSIGQTSFSITISVSKYIIVEIKSLLCPVSFHNETLILTRKSSAPRFLTSNTYNLHPSPHRLTPICFAMFNVKSARAKTTDRDPLINKKGKTISAIWKHFGLKESDEE